MGLLERLNNDSAPVQAQSQPSPTPVPQIQIPQIPTPPASNQMSGNNNKSIVTDRNDLQSKVHKRLTEYMASNNSSSKDIHYIQTTLEQIFYEMHESASPWKELIIENIIHSITGYGPLDALLADEEVTEIICCSYDNIWTERKGKMHQEVGLAFNSERDFRNIIESKILQPIGRRVDDNQPIVNARLEDKSRVNVVIDPISAGGATLDIRKFKKEMFTIKDYLENNSLTEKMADFIKQCIIYKKNIIISGGTGSGKTTLMNCFSTFIPPEEAIITIEDTLELQLKQLCLRRFEARAANSEGEGEITIRKLLVNSLRQRPERIIIGECRSDEIVDMLQAANTGHDGTITSVHANSPYLALNDRIYNMYLMSNIGDVPEKAIKAQIADAINMVVQIKRMPDGTRKVVSVCEVIGFGSDAVEKNNEFVVQNGLSADFETKNSTNIIIQEIFRFNESTGKYESTGWIPTFWEDFRRLSEYTLADGKSYFVKGDC